MSGLQGSSDTLETSESRTSNVGAMTAIHKWHRPDPQGASVSVVPTDVAPEAPARDDDDAEFEQEQQQLESGLKTVQRTLSAWTPDQRQRFMARMDPMLRTRFGQDIGSLFAVNHFALLPAELRLRIFSGLCFKSLLVVERVCCMWQRDSLKIWHQRYESEGYPPPKDPPTTDEKWKYHYLTTRFLYESARKNWAAGRCEKHVIAANSNGIYCLQYDEDKIVCGSRDNNIRIWDMASRQLLRKLEGHHGSVLCLQYDDHKIISGSSDHSIKWWDLRTGLCVNTFEKHTSSVLHLMFDNELLVSCSKDNSILLWKFDPSEPANLIHTGTLMGHQAPVNVVQFDKRFIVSAGGDKTIRVWRRAQGTLARCLEGHARGIACLHFRKDLVVSGSSDNSIKLWDVCTGQLLRSIEDAHTDLVRCIRMDDNHIVSGSYDLLIKLWDLKTGWGIRTFRGHDHRVFKLQFDALSMVSCSHDDKLIIWDFRPQCHGAAGASNADDEGAAVASE